jgi:hypothetical protein
MLTSHPAKLLLLLAALLAAGWDAPACLGNEPPLAAAGADRQGPTGTSVLLDGRGSSDPEGQQLTYHWRFAATPVGSRAVLFGADSFLASFTPDTAGDYFIELNVSDGELTGSDALRLRAIGTTVVLAPTAVALAPSQVRPGERVTLDGTASFSPSGVTLAYSWRLLGGIPVNLVGTSSAKASFRSLDPGLVQAELRVSDGVRQSLPTTVSVVILDVPPLVPAVDAGGQRSGTVGSVLRFSGRVLAPKGPGSVTIRWTYEAGPVAVVELRNQATVYAEFVPASPGVYQFRLSANDGQDEGEDRATAVIAAPVSSASAGGGGGFGGCSLGGAGGSSWLDLWPLVAGGVWLLLRRPAVCAEVRGPAADSPGLAR